MKVRRTLFLGFVGLSRFGWHICEMDHESREIAKLGPVFEGIVDVMGAVVDAVTWLLEQFNKLADWLESHGINLRRWVGRIIGVVSALGLLAAGIRLVLGFLRPLLNVLSAISARLGITAAAKRALGNATTWLRGRLAALVGVPGFTRLIKGLIRNGGLRLKRVGHRLRAAPSHFLDTPTLDRGEAA